MRAVLFDVVGTLLHLREPVGETYARLARSYRVRAAPASLQRAFAESLRRMPPMAFPGRSEGEVREAERGWWRVLVGRTFRTVRTDAGFRDFDSFFAEAFEHFARPVAWRLADGALDALATLRARGLSTGVVSNFDYRLHGLLDGLGLRPLLDVVVLPADAGAAKPEARIFEAALLRLGLPAEEVVYVGDDAEQDVAAANAAGLNAIDVSRLRDLSELPERIADLEQAHSPARS